MKESSDLVSYVVHWNTGSELLLSLLHLWKNIHDMIYRQVSSFILDFWQPFASTVTFLGTVPSLVESILTLNPYSPSRGGSKKILGSLMGDRFRITLPFVSVKSDEPSGDAMYDISIWRTFESWVGTPMSFKLCTKRVGYRNVISGWDVVNELAPLAPGAICADNLSESESGDVTDATTVGSVNLIGMHGSTERISTSEDERERETF